MDICLVSPPHFLGIMLWSTEQCSFLLGGTAFTCFGYIARRQVTGACGGFVLKLWHHCHTLLYVGCTKVYSPQHWRRSLFSTSLLMLVTFCLCEYSHPNSHDVVWLAWWAVKVSMCSHTCFSLYMFSSRKVHSDSLFISLFIFMDVHHFLWTCSIYFFMGCMFLQVTLRSSGSVPLSMSQELPVSRLSQVSPGRPLALESKGTCTGGCVTSFSETQPTCELFMEKATLVSSWYSTLAEC